jgi:hypothetical protein
MNEVENKNNTNYQKTLPLHWKQSLFRHNFIHWFQFC